MSHQDKSQRKMEHGRTQEEEEEEKSMRTSRYQVMISPTFVRQ